MIELLLVLAPLLPVVSPTLDALEDGGVVLCAVWSEGDEALTTSLVRQGEVWHDAGTFLVAALPRDLVAALGARGVRVAELGDPDVEGDLWTISEREVAFLGGALAPPHTELLRADGVRLLRLPTGARPEAAGTRGLHGHHVGMARVVRRAWSPGAPFTWRGHGAAGQALAAAGADPRVQALVDRVDKTRLRDTVVALSALFTRRSTLPEAFVAQDMVGGWFQEYGLSPYLEDFNSLTSDNVVAEIPGVIHPDEIVVIGAHYDSANYQGPVHAAPGADDNASGTAGVLEAARILASAGPFDRTLRFILFSGEEQGLLGSDWSARNSKSQGENIVAMLNTDMNAYRAWFDTRSCDFVTNSTNSALRSFCQAAGALYVPDWATNSGSLSGGTSDHASYHAQGFPAVFFFEDVGNYSPYIHTYKDTTGWSAVDFDLAEMIVKTVVASAVAKAEVVGVQVLHDPLPDSGDAWGAHEVAAQVTSAEGATITEVTLHYSGDDGQTWFTSPMADAGGGGFTGAIPSFGAPVVIRYYVTAADDQGGSGAAPYGSSITGPTFSFFVGAEEALYSTGFEGPGDEGWTHGWFQGPDDWQRGTPAGEAGDPLLAFEGTSVWGNDLGGATGDGAYAANAWNWLRSPPIDCASATNVTLCFQRWLSVERATDDQAQILVDGVLVWENDGAADTIDGGWTAFVLDVSTEAAGKSSVEIEFLLRSDDAQQHGGWTLDDLAVVERSAPAGNMFVFGSGVNPAGSMTLVGGTASTGQTATVAVDNPLGTQGAGALTFLFVSGAPDPAYPAGTLLPGFGMAGAGADGELLISIVSPDPSLTLVGAPWTGAPHAIDVAIPGDPALVGTRAYGQGLLLDPVAASGIRFGLTDGVVFEIGG